MTMEFSGFSGCRETILASDILAAVLDQAKSSKRDSAFHEMCLVQFSNGRPVGKFQ